ncbi:MAG TPA: response regulator [Candidatus Sulfotelmatobacter sp.]|nr:response regulator [Candidatus Sulfotelmatobacter sp.]
MSLNSDPSFPNREQNFEPETQSTHQRTLLVVDDEKVLREIIAKVLRREGYLILEAATQEAATEAVHRSGRKLDLLISDMTLPGEGGGLRLFEELRESNPELRAIFISGRTLEEVCQDGPLPEGTAFLEKPFENERLVNTVREILG